MVVKRVIVQNGAGHQGKGKVAAVDGDALSLGKVHARLAAAQLAVIGDVIVDKRGGLKMLDGSGGAHGRVECSAHRLASEHADKRTMAFARVG